MRHTQSFMSSKLTEVHQSNVFDLIMHNFDPLVAAPSIPCSGFFHTYASGATIIDHFKNGKIIRGYHYPQYSKHVIVVFCQPDEMLGLIALQADISVDEQYESGIYFCSFSDDATLATSSPRQYICQKLSVRAMMLPLKNSNEEFQMKYSIQ